MKKSILKTNFAAALLLLAGILSAPTAVASNTWHLNETFASGATFSGDLTFDSDLSNLLGVTGLLSGGGYGNIPITWAWWAGTLQAPVVHYTGDPSTTQDWLMSGTPGIPVGYTTPGFGFDGSAVYTYFIGISWFAPSTSGDLVMDLNGMWFYSSILEHNSGYTGFFDPVIEATVSPVPEPETYAMLLIGLGLISFTLHQGKFKTSTFFV